MTVLKALALAAAAPCVMYGALWLTVACAQDARDLLTHLRGRMPR